VFAPKTCSTTSCTNTSCDGYNCYTSFPEDEFLAAENYFTDNLLSSVENAKLDRPIDSTPPLARSVYVAQESYWGDHWGHDQAYQTEDWQSEEWYEQNEEHPEYSMEYEEDPHSDGDEDNGEEVYMTQDNETQGQEFFGDEDATDEEDDDSYE
jgi:hypothetical protein